MPESSEHYFFLSANIRGLLCYSFIWLKILMCSFSFSPVLYQAKFPTAFHTLLSQTSQTRRFQGVGPRWAKFVSSSDSQDPVMFTEVYIHKCLNFFEALSRSFTPLSPLVQLSGTPPLVAERGFSPKGGSSPEQKGPTEK